MFSQVGENEKGGGMPWGVLGGLLGFAALLAVGYMMIT